MTDTNNTSSDSPSESDADADETVWTHRGYRLKSSDFTTAMVHLYRGEIARSNTWRQRLDATTNWAVVVTGAAISFALSSPEHHHAVIIINTLLVVLFCYIEARRYRYYELWAYRVRMMEEDFYGAMLVPPFHPSPDWAESLAESLLHPDFSISLLEAWGRRFRRNYLWIFIILSLAWLLKITIHPDVAITFNDLLLRAAVGPIPGWVVMAIGVAFNGGMFILGALTVVLQDAPGEVLPHYAPLESMFGNKDAVVGQPAPHEQISVSGAGKAHGRGDRRRLFRRRRQLLAFVISNRSNAIAECVQKEMHRGITALHATGMYTGTERNVLLVAATVTEIPALKQLVRRTDPDALIIVLPALEIFGKGFRTLRKGFGA